MSKPEQQIKKQQSRFKRKESSEDEDDESPQKGSFMSEIRGTISRGTNMMRTGVSKKKGIMVRVMKRRFPRKTNIKESKSKGANSSGNLKFQAASPPLYPQLRDSWLGIKTEDVAKDIHRLIYRVTVKTSGIETRNVLMKPPSRENRGGNVHCATSVIALIKLLARRMLDAEELARISEICDEMLPRVEDKTDLITFNLELFSRIGEDSKILRVLRCINQGLVSKPYGILRTVMIKDKMTRDVRTDDGWQVVVTVANEGFVQVTHVRKEQSIDLPTVMQPDKSKNHWEYEWEVSMTFDGNMKDMTQSRLSVTNLILSDDMDPELEQELRFIMQNGNLIVF